MIGLQGSFILWVIAIMVVMFAMVAVIGEKVTENKRNVKARENYIIGKKEKEETLKSEGNTQKSKKKSVNKKSSISKISERLAEELAKSDVLMKPEEFLIMWICVTFIPALFVLIVFKNQVFAPMIMIAGAIAPIFYLKNKQKKRVELFESQLSDALMIASNCIKSGLTFNQAMDTIADECDDPIGSEFKRTVNEITFGATQDDALEAMAKRVKSADFNLVVSAVNVQRQTGGNLSEILDTIAATIRQRYKIRGEIKSITAQGRTSGIIIGVLPIALLFIMSFVSKDYTIVFFTTTIGNILLLVGAVLEIFAAIIINKIVTVKF